jgi:hypothetical protein
LGDRHDALTEQIFRIASLFDEQTRKLTAQDLEFCGGAVAGAEVANGKLTK